MKIIKTKNFCSIKDTIKRFKRQAIDSKKTSFICIYVIYIFCPINDLSIIHKESLQINKENTRVNLRMKQ